MEIARLKAELAAKDEKIGDLSERLRIVLKMDKITATQAEQTLRDNLANTARLEMDIVLGIQEELQKTKNLKGEHSPQEVIAFKGSLVRIFKAFKLNGITA